MNAASESAVKAEIHAVVERNGKLIDLGVITSPYNDPIRNWLWKKRKEVEIRRLLHG